ncbi:hypothetical protein L6164_020061 [Bauhinia variegata]|uniref:Uncharacterized protein n=1 Tax=Bauhinia variegata TaxID=167791 RepID=A0ACB9MU86_BAUVA|nr:hypothetical protein L6164_020061 [Bauhinia variegata]
MPFTISWISQFALVRESAVSNPGKGDLTDHESLVKAIKQVDIVISTVGGEHFPDQVNIIAAIKEAGKIKRFLPSEFGLDVDRHSAVEPAASFFETKAKIRRATEGEGIPYTYICSNAFAGYFLPNLGQLNAKALLGGTRSSFKAMEMSKEDIASYAIKAVDDPRTLNKSLYIRPPANVLTFNELVSSWENKIGNKLEKTYVSENQLLRNIQGK